MMCVQFTLAGDKPKKEKSVFPYPMLTRINAHRTTRFNIRPKAVPGTACSRIRNPAG